MKLRLLLVVIFVSGCTQSGYKKFYTPYVDAKTLPDVELLAKGENPKVYGTDDPKKDTLTLLSKNYILIGYSSFNSGIEDTKNAAAQAKRIGATIVLVDSKYTNTQTNTSLLFLPDNKTTYNSGTVSGNTTYNSANGGYLGNSNTRGMYNGTSTTYGTQAVPITRQQMRYNQEAGYFVKSTKKYKVGIQFKDLTPEQRAKLERNTGVLVTVVIEDSPAFNSNVLVGDVLIDIDGQLVKNQESAMQLLGNITPDKKSSQLTVIRNDSEKKIEIQF